jgi:hypothetical protein
MIGEFLYSLSASEAQSQAALQRVLQNNNNAIANTTVTLQLTPVPLDKIFILQNLNFFSQAGAAQTTNSWRIEIRDASNNILAEIVRDQPPAPILAWGTPYVINDLIIMPGERIALSTFYSAAGVANFCQLDAVGVFLPKGTVQFR